MVILISIAILIVVALLIISFLLPKIEVNRITKQVNKTTEMLKRLIDNNVDFGLEDYSNWLKHNLIELWLRSLTHTTGNKKLRGELGGKLWMACNAIDKIITRDHVVSIAIKSGNIDFTSLDDMKNEREQLKAIIEQVFTDITFKLSQ